MVEATLTLTNSEYLELINKINTLTQERDEARRVICDLEGKNFAYPSTLDSWSYNFERGRRYAAQKRSWLGLYPDE